MSSGSTRPARRSRTSDSSPAWATAAVRSVSRPGEPPPAQPAISTGVTWPATARRTGCAGVDHERRRRPLAQAEARRRVGARAADRAAVGPPLARQARSVQTWTWCGSLCGEREQCVEAGDAVDLGGRDVEPLGDVVDRGRADPADAVVDGVQRRQQQVPARLVDVTAADDVQRPRALGAQHGLDGGPFVVGRRCRPGLERSMRSSVSRDCQGNRELVDADRGRLELGGAALRIGGVDRDDVDVDLVGEVERS